MNDFQWAEEMNCAVTVCDCDGVILYQNAPAREIYKSHGDLIGTNLMPCHNANSQAIIRHMLATGESNAYTIEKNGVHKMIYQTPWRRDGQIAGLVEISPPSPTTSANKNKLSGWVIVLYVTAGARRCRRVFYFLWVKFF